jgi:hypothetical protein
MNKKEQSKQKKQELIKKYKEVKEKQNVSFEELALQLSNITNYSLNNCLLMAIQLLERNQSIEEIKEIAPASYFFKNNKKIKKGSKALYIFAPTQFKEKQENKDSEKEAKINTGFILVPVFTDQEIEEKEFIK